MDESTDAGTAIAVLSRIADDLDAAARWGADVRLPPGLEPALRRLLSYATPARPSAPTQPGTIGRATTESASRPHKDDSGPVGTDLVIELLRDAPGKLWTIDELQSAMERRGWSTTSPSPRGVIANTVGKARERYSQIQRGPRRGTYRWVDGPTQTPSDSEAPGEPSPGNHHPNPDISGEKGAMHGVADHRMGAPFAS